MAKTFTEVAQKEKMHITDYPMYQRYLYYMKSRWADEEELLCRVGKAYEWVIRFMDGCEYTASDSTGKAILYSMDRQIHYLVCGSCQRNVTEVEVQMKECFICRYDKFRPIPVP